MQLIILPKDPPAALPAFRKEEALTVILQQITNEAATVEQAIEFKPCITLACYKPLISESAPLHARDFIYISQNTRLCNPLNWFSHIFFEWPFCLHLIFRMSLFIDCWITTSVVFFISQLFLLDSDATITIRLQGFILMFMKYVFNKCI